ncbi:protein timeless isoform X2 [Papilio machaon]|uniref:protein timeless isoform X2 n=1 Tax=Papilio machaon TaxID=76193 RepID=UPI001E662E8F|nr:protein timeless isoform X2 [Papilio machaon]
MEWVLRSPQLHSTFSNLGFLHSDGYHVNEHCNAALETILHNILTEDKYLCTYRRSISFGQNIKKDLIPLLINAKEDKTIELVIKILVNLTIPIECLLSMDAISKTGFGRHTIFEVNNLLATTKLALTDHRATKVIIEFLKKNSNLEQKSKLSSEQCVNISNTLLFLRNILYIPEHVSELSLAYNGSQHSVQNQLLWNLFSQNFDIVLIKLMCMPDATNWAVTMVQLIALLYKDQHVTTLHKLLNLWLDASISESSEDNESNTSPQDRGSKNSSPNLTSNPTSDSSDAGGSGKSNDEANFLNNDWDASSRNNMNRSQPFQFPRSADNHVYNNSGDSGDGCDGGDASDGVDNLKDTIKSDTPVSASDSNENDSENYKQRKSEKKVVISGNSDYGYVTQIENQESISTSSNEDELPTKKPLHQKPHTNKQRINNKVRSTLTLQERKRKKIVKKGRINITTLQGHNSLTDDDISNVLKDFTINFLLKGYNSLVKTLHKEILTNAQLEIDTSHFFWLVTYFLKFATQIELDLDHVCSVLSFEIISYLTAEGVNLCEQFEIARKLDGNDLKPNVRRLHLVVTAIREFVQTIELYKKSPHTCDDDQDKLVSLQMKMCETDELRSLLVLLLRNYNPKYHPKQYLQDLIVTNHILLMFLDNGMKMPDYKGSASMPDHIKQFATPEIMSQYGILLEDYECNGEFVNDCIFTMMHHVGGELGCVKTLVQPKILKTFTSICQAEFEICDDWSDLIEYVINTFIKKPQSLQCIGTIRLESEKFDVDQSKEAGKDVGVKRKSTTSSVTNANERWTENEISSLSWNYIQCNTTSDVIGEVLKLFKEDGIIKKRDSVIKELFKQSIISKEEFEKLLKSEMDRNSKAFEINKEMRDDEIGKLCEQLAQDGKSKFLNWVQTVLLDTCYAKIYFEKKAQMDIDFTNKDKDMDNTKDPIASSVSYHSLVLKQSVPLVPWNCEQASICKDLKFLQLLHKLGFHMPVDSGKVFIRIPHFWTPDFIFDVASKISPIEKSKLKFSVSEAMESSVKNSNQRKSLALPSITKDTIMTTRLDNFYQVNKQQQFGALVNFTPMPGSSFSLNEDEFQKPNWLEIVQKSQEYKISFDVGSIVKEEMVEVKVTEVKGRSDQEVREERGRVRGQEAGAEAGAEAEEASCMPDAALAIPAATSATSATTTTSTKPDVKYNLHLMESEYHNSVCETASVASDLTRMYVSDEDEKPEPMRAPALPVKALCDESSDTPTVEKRPRVTFFPSF